MTQEMFYREVLADPAGLDKDNKDNKDIDNDKDIHTNYSNTKIDFDQLLTSNKKQNRN